MKKIKKIRNKRAEEFIVGKNLLLQTKITGSGNYRQQAMFAIKKKGVEDNVY